MESFQIIVAGDPNSAFDRWVETLRRAGIQATQIAIADYDRERGYNPVLHPRGNEVYVLVPVEQLEDALKILKASEGQLLINTLTVAKTGPDALSNHDALQLDHIPRTVRHVSDLESMPAECDRGTQHPVTH